MRVAGRMIIEDSLYSRGTVHRKVTLESLWRAACIAHAYLLDDMTAEALAVLSEAVEIRERDKPKRRLKYPWLELEIGESREVAGNAAIIRQAGYIAGKRYGRRFSVIDAGGGVVRIKRVAVVSRGIPRLGRRKNRVANRGDV